jgi:hypothetical protein
VTDGYHPFAAAHGDDAYYLNALAGDRRTMACSFDPDLDSVRDAWPSMAADPRLRSCADAAASRTGRAGLRADPAMEPVRPRSASSDSRRGIGRPMKRERSAIC